MAIVMSAGETDDPGFIEVLNSILSELIAEHAPDQFWVIQIDNWFDHKWLGFSGMGLIASNIPLNTYDTVKAESYQEKVTFPPFTPNRVVGQFSFAPQQTSRARKILNSSSALRGDSSRCVFVRCCEATLAAQTLRSYSQHVANGGGV